MAGTDPKTLFIDDDSATPKSAAGSSEDGDGPGRMDEPTVLFKVI